MTDQSLLGQFTDLAVGPPTADTSTPKRHPGPWPASWVRYQFDAPSRLAVIGGEGLLARWLDQTIAGRYGVYAVDLDEARYFVVLFETDQDAVLFRLSEGETAPFRRP